MVQGDFFSSELSTVMAADTSVRIELAPADGSPTQVLKAETKLEGGEVIDAARMDVAKLRTFFEEELSRCEKEGLMASLHLKATTMKVSDPIMFGHAVEVYFKVRR